MPQARAVVRHNVTAMLAEPSDKAERVSEVVFGETVRPLGEDGCYTEIQSPDSYQGWVLTRHLYVLETGERYPDPARAALIAPLFLPLYNGPSSKSDRISLLTLGTVVELGDGDADADFYPIRLPGGGTGYLEGSALIVPQYPPNEHLGPNLVVVAKGLIGVPYLWGGRTPFGMDCSGFTQRVYWLCGKTIPRDAYLQAQWDGFQEVDRDTLEAGDLAYFQGEDPKGRGITHVGIALDDSLFIHASRDLGVTITSLDHSPYDVQFRCSRRIKTS